MLLHLGVQVQVSHGFPQHHAGLNQLDLRIGTRLAARHDAVQVVHDRVTDRGFHLHHGIRFVNRRREQGINNADNGEQGGNPDDQPAVIQQRTKEPAQVDFVIAAHVA